MSTTLNRRRLLLGAASLTLGTKPALAGWDDPWNDTFETPKELDIRVLGENKVESVSDALMTDLDLTLPPSPKAYSGRSELVMPDIIHNDSHHVAEGNIRRLLMNNRTGGALNIVYWRDGEFVEDSIGIITHFMRDWRNNQEKPIDRRTIDFIGKVHAKLETDNLFLLISGYRSPATNRMLIARSKERNGGKSQVAKYSLHLKGQAADLRLAGFTPRQVARAAQSLGVGGVGTYSKSNFCHLDCGRIRTWGA